MKNDWTRWTAGILSGIALFLAGCGEKKTETSPSGPAEQSQSLTPSEPQRSEGLTDPAPEPQKDPLETGKRKKPARRAV